MEIYLSTFQIRAKLAMGRQEAVRRGDKYKVKLVAYSLERGLAETESGRMGKKIKDCRVRRASW